MSELLSIEELRKQAAEDLQIIISQKIYYKYASLATTTNHILPDQTLRFSPPEVFNDPFDCNETLLDIHIEEVHIRSFAGDQLNRMPSELQQAMLKKMLNPTTYRAALQKEKPNFKICCFSKRPDDILMWSHYADKHTGISLGFEFPVRGEIFSMYPVRYIDKIKKLHGMADVSTILHYWLTRKPLCWAYEEEIRAISRSGQDNEKFDKQQLKEIIFGCRVTLQQIDHIKKQVNESGFDRIIFNKMEIDPSTFLLKRVKL